MTIATSQTILASDIIQLRDRISELESKLNSLTGVINSSFKIIDQGSHNESGRYYIYWIRFSNDLFITWGYGGNRVTVSLPRNYRSNDYTVVATSRQGGHTYNVTIDNKTVNSFTVGYEYGVDFYTIGYCVP